MHCSFGRLNRPESRQGIYQKRGPVVAKYKKQDATLIILFVVVVGAAVDVDGSSSHVALPFPVFALQAATAAVSSKTLFCVGVTHNGILPVPVYQTHPLFASHADLPVTVTATHSAFFFASGVSNAAFCVFVMHDGTVLPVAVYQTQSLFCPHADWVLGSAHAFAAFDSGESSTVFCVGVVHNG
mmetsp:Transcript_48865/g.97180  ORF Transcript_48865/g.97180 Transcript_48865/m.97180 type:complete len:184 (+) Transcript_48865:212-763(+)